MPLTPLVRWSLVASGPINLLGAAIFAPPGQALRAAFGFPEAPPLYLWTLAAWVLAFGVAYLHAGWTNRADRSLLALGAFGKLVFFLLVAGMVIQGLVPWTTGLAASPDLFLGAVFARAGSKE